MPTYEYRCRGCGKTLTVIQGIKENPLKTHEGCGGELERLISGGRLMLTERKSGRVESEEFGDLPPMGDDFGGDDLGGMGGMGDEFGGGDFGGDEGLGEGGDWDKGADDEF